MFSKPTMLAALTGFASAGTPITGTNLGGWMVLEPWITPSLFYRFLDKGQGETAMGSYTVCESLGPEEGNKLMRAHWDSWYTEKDIADLAARGVEWVRLPIGDWTLNPYGPYVGCMDGAAEKIDWMMDTCHKHGIKVLIDVHCMKDSQNGFDNGGRTWQLIWHDKTHFEHHDRAEWLCQWDDADGGHCKDNKYNDANFKFSLDDTEALLKRFAKHPAFGAFEPVNEPWWSTPKDKLNEFYRDARKLVQKYAPEAYFVFHDSFHFDADRWNDLFEDTDKVILDHHEYQAWIHGKRSVQEFCDEYHATASTARQIKYDVWIGEWSLATDTCAHWLGGFNNGNDYSDFTCNWVDCPRTYLPDSVATDFNRTAAMHAPYGDGNQDWFQIKNGKCSSDSLRFNSDEIRQIAACAADAWQLNVNGTFLWTAHNEIEPRWDYVKAWDMGWINKTEVPADQYIDYDEFVGLKTPAGVGPLEFVQ